MKEVKMKMGRRGETWDCLGSCMQTTRFSVVSGGGGRPEGNGDKFCWCVGEEG